MDTALPQKFPFILDRNLANCTGNRVCTSCDTVVFGASINYQINYYLIIYAWLIVKKTSGRINVYLKTVNTFNRI